MPILYLVFALIIFQYVAVALLLMHSSQLHHAMYTYTCNMVVEGSSKIRPPPLGLVGKTSLQQQSDYSAEETLLLVVAIPQNDSQIVLFLALFIIWTHVDARQFVVFFPT